MAPVCADLNLRAILVPMHRPKDIAFAEQVAQAMPDPVEIVRAGLPTPQLLALIGGCHLVVAMRLHALIFAALSGVAPVAISYDPKIEGMMAELELPVATSAASFDGEALAEAIRTTFESREAVARAAQTRAIALRAAALRNIELALSVLP